METTDEPLGDDHALVWPLALAYVAAGAKLSDAVQRAVTDIMAWKAEPHRWTGGTTEHTLPDGRNTRERVTDTFYATPDKVWRVRNTRHR